MATDFPSTFNEDLLAGRANTYRVFTATADARQTVRDARRMIQESWEVLIKADAAMVAATSCRIGRLMSNRVASIGDSQGVAFTPSRQR